MKVGLRREDGCGRKCEGWFEKGRWLFEESVKVGLRREDGCGRKCEGWFEKGRWLWKKV